MKVAEFQELIWRKNHELFRPMPWRDDPSFYHVLVSELMLQQTQVARVLVKFEEFMYAFPTIKALANAPLAEVLRAWQGLGYNRRAKFLHDAAKYVAEHGQPITINELVKLPGVGRNTAGAIMNYVYEIPTPFIETNIRSVYIKHFLPNEISVSDRDIYELVEKTLDDEHPRQWFWALMDYGSWLKAQGAGNVSLSRHYRKQAPLKGSVREVRGQILKSLTDVAEMSLDELRIQLKADERFDIALEGLKHDGLIECRDTIIYLTKR